MKRLILILMLAFGANAYCQTTSFTEFYCTGSGDNLNAGSTTGNTAVFSAASGFFTNNLTAAVCGWYKPGVDLSSVNVGDWASIFPDTSASNCFVGRITYVSDAADTIQVSLSAKAGNVPASDNVGATSLRVGGAWRGPGTGSLFTNENFFPFGFAVGTMVNALGNGPRINFKAGTYSITNAMYHNIVGPLQFQGYTSTPGDGGKAIFDAGSPATSFNMYKDGSSAKYINYYDMIFQNNGSSGSGNGFVIAAAAVMANRIVAHHIRGIGIAGAQGNLLVECEAYFCGLDGASAGISSGDNACIRCFAHDNGAIGFNGSGATPTYVDCLSISNASHGFGGASSSILTLINCDVYGNGGSGIFLISSTAGGTYVENCNFFKNATYAISGSTATAQRFGYFINNCVGAGSQANTSGITISQFTTNGCLWFIGDTTTYASGQNPYVSSLTGNFSITNTASTRNKGRGVFPNNTNSYAATVGYPDIGAAHTTNSASAGGETSHVFAQ